MKWLYWSEDFGEDFACANREVEAANESEAAENALASRFEAWGHPTEVCVSVCQLHDGQPVGDIFDVTVTVRAVPEFTAGRKVAVRRIPR